MAAFSHPSGPYPASEPSIFDAMTTLREAINAYISYMEFRRKRPRSRFQYRHHLTQFETWLTAEIGRPPRLRDITPQRVIDYLKDRTTRWSDTTVNLAVTTFRGFGKYIARAGWQWEPAPLVNAEGIENPRSRQRVRVTEEEIATMLDAADRHGRPLWGLRDRAMIHVLCETGIRRAELLGMRWRHIDHDACSLCLPVVKGGRSHTVPLPSTSRAALRAYQQGLAIAGRPSEGDAHVWQSLSHPDMGDVGLRVAWRELLTRARMADRIEGDDALTPHCMRHSLVTRSLAKGIPPAVVQQVTGHRNLQTLLGYQRDLTPTEMRGFAEQFSIGGCAHSSAAGSRFCPDCGERIA